RDRLKESGPTAGSGNRSRSPLAEPALGCAVANNAGETVSVIKTVFVDPFKTNHPCHQQNPHRNHEREKFMRVPPSTHCPQRPQSSSVSRFTAGAFEKANGL